MSSIIQKILEQCKVCAKNASAPRLLKLTTGSEELRFNHSVEVYTMWKDGKPVVQIMDKARHFSAAKCVKGQRAAYICHVIRFMLFFLMWPSGILNGRPREQILLKGVPGLCGSGGN